MFEHLKVIHYPDPRLRKKSRPVEAFDDRLRALAARMFDLMRQEKGVGLAAPQIGVNERLFVMNATGEPADDQIVVNPVLTVLEGSACDEEGCLSIPEVRVDVLRGARLHLRAQDGHGAFFEQTSDGLPARVWQHETDHLDGVLLTDKMGPLDKLRWRKRLKELEETFRRTAMRKATAGLAKVGP